MRMTVLALLLCGCATWTKPGSTERDFEMDKGYCMAQAYSANSMYTTVIYMQCMKGRGWEPH